MPLQLRILAFALMDAVALLGLVVFFVVRQDGDVGAAPPLWLVAGQLLAGLVVHVLIEAVGYRAGALPPAIAEDEARRRSLQALQAGTVLRGVLAESVAIASLVAAFVLQEGGFLGYVVGAAVSLALMAVHVWPGSRPVAKTIAALERDGGCSRLREVMDGSGATGPVREL